MTPLRLWKFLCALYVRHYYPCIFCNSPSLLRKLQYTIALGVVHRWYVVQTDIKKKHRISGTMTHTKNDWITSNTYLHHTLHPTQSEDLRKADWRSQLQGKKSIHSFIQTFSAYALVNKKELLLRKFFGLNSNSINFILLLSGLTQLSSGFLSCDKLFLSPRSKI